MVKTASGSNFAPGGIQQSVCQPVRVHGQYIVACVKCLTGPGQKPHQWFAVVEGLTFTVFDVYHVTFMDDRRYEARRVASNLTYDEGVMNATVWALTNV
jgi:hypothetical protein